MTTSAADSARARRAALELPARDVLNPRWDHELPSDFTLEAGLADPLAYGDLELVNWAAEHSQERLGADELVPLLKHLRRPEARVAWILVLRAGDPDREYVDRGEVDQNRARQVFSMVMNAK